MDGRARRAEFLGSSSRSFGNSSNPEGRSGQGQPRNLPPAIQSSSSSQTVAAKFRTSSLATPYGSVPGLLFDPLLFSSLQRPYLMPQVHPGLPVQSGYQATMAGLNQLNPVLLLSSNDNNNCNRSRAASHSSVLEIHQNRALGIPYPVPAGAHYPYFIPDIRPNLLHNTVSYRRNSTNTSLPHDGVLNHGTQDLNLPPPYDRPPPPYPTVTNASVMLQSSAFHPLRTNQVPVRRERYSFGGPLTTSDMASRSAALLRRNSIPTALEIQATSEESTENSSSVDDDDDDDVFESTPPPLSAPHSATDAASFLEQLRESRKRASTSGDGPSQSKYPCPVNELRRPRFRRCDGDTDVKDDGAMQQESDSETEDLPGTSQQASAESTSGGDTNSAREVPMETEPAPSNSKILGQRTATPSPSILKNPRIMKINRGGLKQSAKSETQNNQSQVQSSTPERERSRVKSQQIKKQVAWKDSPRIDREEQDSVTPPIKHNMISDQFLHKISKKPDNFLENYRMGPFLFGPKLGTSPVKSITQYLVRKADSYKYYLAKVLMMGGSTNDDRSGRLLLYSEHSLLTLLKNHPGVVREHGLYKDVAYDPKTGKARERVCLVLDCLTPHEFDPETKDYLVLQKYVMKVGHLMEWETIKIFTLILNIVHSLHELNVVHRDLKLENMVLLEKSQKVILTNFCLGRHLMSDDDLLKDRRGSPAYISPDVLSGKPYAGKPSDMWSLGVVLFMMLYGQFPFYDKDPTQLFKKIRKAEFTIPSNFNTSMQINDIIVGLLTPDPSSRLTSGETLLALQKCVSSRTLNRYSLKEVQVVPDIDDENETASEPEENKTDDLSKEEENLTREFRLKLLSDDEDSTPSLSRTQAFARTSYQSTLPTLQHCPYDARPLTQEEIAMHRRLLVNSTLGVRVQGSS